MRERQMPASRFPSEIPPRYLQIAQVMGWSLPELLKMGIDEFNIWQKHVTNHGTGDLAGKEQEESRSAESGGDIATTKHKSQQFIRTKTLEIAARNKATNARPKSTY